MSVEKHWDIAIKVEIDTPPADTNWKTNIRYTMLISDISGVEKQRLAGVYHLVEEYDEFYTSLCESCFSIANFINMSEPETLVTISFDGKCMGYHPDNSEDIQNKIIDWLFTFRKK